MSPPEALALTLACGLVVVGAIRGVSWAAGKIIDGIFWATRHEG